MRSRTIAVEETFAARFSQGAKGVSGNAPVVCS
jgi:hypothetical protein